MDQFRRTRKRRPKTNWHVGTRLVALVPFLLLVSISACNTAVAQVDSTEAQAQQARAEGAESSMRHQLRAIESREDGNYQVCAELFSSAARADTDSSQTSQRWFQASRCSARAGDYRRSMFYLQAAASTGFDQLSTLLSEPLLRPLHHEGRWLLIVDLISANEADNQK